MTASKIARDIAAVKTFDGDLTGMPIERRNMSFCMPSSAKFQNAERKRVLELVPHFHKLCGGKNKHHNAVTWKRARNSLVRVTKTHRLREWVESDLCFSPKAEVLAIKPVNGGTDFDWFFIEVSGGLYEAEAFGSVIRHKDLRVVATLLWAMVLEECCSDV